MTYRKFFLAAAFVAASAIPAAAQGPGLFGFYDPATGAFTPVPPPVAVPAAGVAARLHRLARRHVHIQDHVRIVSNLDPAEKPNCSASVSHSTGNLYYSECASKTANRNGNTATCTMRIPYLWAAANNANGVSFSLYVSASNRSLNQNLPPIALPPNATTTNLEATVRL